MSLFSTVLLGGGGNVAGTGQLPKLEPAKGEGKAAGRLWEDPLELTDALAFRPFERPTSAAPPEVGSKQDFEDDSALPANGVEPGSSDLASPNAPVVAKEEPPKRKEKLALFVPLRGFRYTETSEWRRRQRYALHAALWSKGYVRRHPDDLFYKDLTIAQVFEGKKETPAIGTPWWFRVPFEEYRLETPLEGGLPMEVTVFYVNFDLLDLPLRRIYAIACALEVNDCRMAVTSPPNTQWLAAMLSEDVVSKGIAGDSRIEVFNSQATGLSREFIDPETRKLVPTRKITIDAKQEAKLDVIIHELIEPDAFSIESVIDELKARGVNIGGGSTFHGSPSTLAIVTEWETQFGREFGEKIKQRVGHQRQLLQSPAVLSLYYLRGIDGQPQAARIPGRVPDTSGGAPGIGEAKTAGEVLSRVIDPPVLPSPVGGSQFDYLARMREQLLSTDAERRRRGEGAIRAIGLISTDTDDKLALLKTLRPRFPDVIFFTNGMEADFLQPENSKVTRNLLVSTRYDLEGEVFGNERWNLRAQLPLFRSSSQVALVDAVWSALCGHAPAEVRKASIREIGLRRSYRLEQGAVELGPLEIESSAAGTRGDGWRTWLPSTTPSITVVGIWLLGLSGALGIRWMVANQQREALIRARANQVTQWVRWSLNWLLGSARPSLNAHDLESLWNGKLSHIEEPKPEPASTEAKNVWVVSLTLVILAFGWWIVGGPWSANVILVSSVLALSWLRVNPKEKDARIFRRILAGSAALMAVMAIGRFLAKPWLLEPMALADGVCVWPAVALRILAALLALRFVPVAWRELCLMRDACTQRFFLERLGDFAQPARLVGEEIGPVPEREFGKCWLIARDFPEYHQIDQGSNPDAERSDLVKHHEVAEWIVYLKETDPHDEPVLRRWSRWIGASLLLAAAVMGLIGFPSANTRGNFAGIADFLSLAGVLVSLMVLCVFVGDQLWQCGKFVRRIWGHGTTGFGLELEETLVLVGRLTSGLGHLLIYPFVVCFVLLCAHSTYIEQWRGLAGLYAVLAVMLGVLLALTWQTQRIAQCVRTSTISYLQLAQAEALWLKRLVLQRPDMPDDPDPKKSVRHWWQYTMTRLGRHLTLPEMPRTLTAFDQFHQEKERTEETLDDMLASARARDVAFQDARVAQMERVIKLVSGLKEGAFGGWYENPILRAVLIPGAGLGSLELIRKFLLG